GQNHDTDLTAQSKIFIHDEMAPQPLAPPPKLRANHDQGSAIRVRYFLLGWLRKSFSEKSLSVLLL
ncbi:MAG TPA: hypothetical protein VLI39_21125, partial [Sedimentisphaerales bacterium]|nr:hypothetical protein [Sedimentisphaerales bacterium]